MKVREIAPTLNCDLDLLREVLGRKWKLSLLYFAHQGRRRPSQLPQQLPDAMPHVLTLQLKQVVSH